MGTVYTRGNSSARCIAKRSLKRTSRRSFERLSRRSQQNRSTRRWFATSSSGKKSSRTIGKRAGIRSTKSISITLNIASGPAPARTPRSISTRRLTARISSSGSSTGKVISIRRSSLRRVADKIPTATRRTRLGFSSRPSDSKLFRRAFPKSSTNRAFSATPRITFPR